VGGRGDHRAAARTDRSTARAPRGGAPARAPTSGFLRRREQDAPRLQEDAAPPVTEVLEYRPYEDGYLQRELRRYVRRDGSTRERGPYWIFQFHEGGKRKKFYPGKTSEPESTLVTKRAKPHEE
jgi:hypothetical protein